MRRKNLLKILISPLLIFLFLSFVSVMDVAVLHACDLGFPRIICDPPWDANGFQYPFFGTLKAEGFNCLIVSYYNTPIEDYEYAKNNVQINLIASDIRSPYAEGQWVRYDAGNHAEHDCFTTYRFLDQYDTTIVGRVRNRGKDTVDYDAHLDWAWCVLVSDSTGYVQSGLLNEKNIFNGYGYDRSREQELPDGGPMTQPLTYYASFRLKVPSGGTHSSSDTVARIEAWLLNSDSTLNSCADSVLLYSDFEDSLGYYKNFLISFVKTLNEKDDSLDYRIYWYGNTDLFVDYCDVWDDIYEKLINDPDTNYIGQIEHIVDSLQQPYAGNCLFRWYLKDEPNYDQYRVNNYMNRFLESHPQGIDTVYGIQASGSCGSRVNTKFNNEVNPHEIFYDDYPIIWFWYDENLQAKLNDFTNYLKIVSTNAHNTNKEWWYIAQTYAGGDAYRYPHNSELKCTVYLALAYGAKGIGYFRYTSYILGGLVREEGQIWVPVETFHDSSGYSSKPETLLTAVKEINYWLDSTGTILRAIEWQGTCVDSSYNNYDLLSCGAGYIDSVRSHNPVDEPHWVQVGFFDNQAGDTSYFMLVNRECLETEGANYDVFVTKTGGHYQIRDTYTDSLVDYVNGTGDGFTIYLGPGEGKLLRLESTPEVPSLSKLGLLVLFLLLMGTAVWMIKTKRLAV